MAYSVLRFTKILMTGLVLVLLSSAGWAWEYQLGQIRHQQQANFCDTKEDAQGIIQVFTRYGVNTGYAALSNASGCNIRIETFTPVQILDTVTIAAGEAIEYTLHLVEVDIVGVNSSYLMTTRQVNQQPQN